MKTLYSTSLLFIILSAGQLAAAPIPGLFHTGVNDAGAPLADGAIDPHYKLIVNPDTGSTNALVESSTAFPIVAGPWLPDTISKWIGPRLNTSASAVGVYTYRTTIDLTGLDPSTARIIGRWAADNTGNDILVNGVSTGNPQSPGFDSYTPFVLVRSNATFVAGLNTIDFVVENVENVGYTGLRVEMAGTAQRASMPPTILQHPQSLCASEGGSAMFGVLASGSPTPTYQWQKDGMNLPGETGTNLVITPIFMGDEGDYRVIVTNPVGSVTSLVARLTVGLALTNPSFEADAFSVAPGYVSGNGPITGWNALGGHGINPGVGGFSPFADNGTIPDGAQVAFLQQDGAMSQIARCFTVNKQYYVQYDENSRQGDSATDPALAVTIGGTNIVAAHTVPPVGGSNPYRRVISEVFVASATDLEIAFIKSNPRGGDNTVLLDNIRITEVASNTPPSLIHAPAPQIVQVGDSVTFSVQAFGSLPFTFQWRKDGVDISGAIESTLTLNSIQKSDEADYSVKVSNGAGMVTSPDAPLTVFEPIPDLFNTGVNNSRVPLADGAVDPHYRLIQNPDTGSTDAIVEDSTAFPIAAGPWLPNTSISKWIGPRLNTSDGAVGVYVYRTTIDLTGRDPSTVLIIGRWVTDNAGNDILVNGVSTGNPQSPGFDSYTPFVLASSNATFVAGSNAIDFVVENVENVGYTGLRVEMAGTAQRASMPPTILQHPQSLCASEGGSAMFGVLASGSPTPTYQWQKDGMNLPGETGTNLVITPIFMGDEGDYRVIVTNPVGSVTSLVARLTVGLALTNPSFEADAFSVAPGYVSGNGPITGWNALGGHGINPGVGGFSPFADNGTIPDGAQVAFLQQDGAMSQIARCFTVNKQYYVQYDENSRQGDSATDPALAVTIGGTNIVAAHTVPPVGGSNPYRRVISEVFVASATDLEIAFIKSNPRGGDNTVLLDNIRITEVASNTPPSLIHAPAPQIVQVGDSVTFSVQAFGSLPFTFQWRKDGVDISGAIESTLTLNSIQKSDEADYSVKVSNGAGMVTSPDAPLTVFEPIPDLFNTGVNNSRVPLADGAVDPHYRLIQNPDTGSTDAIVEDSTAFPIAAGPWLPNTSISKWIGPRLNTSDGAVGVYVYRTTIDLTGRDPSTVLIIGRWVTDNAGNDILVNGVSTGNSPSPGFTNYTPFVLASANSAFVAGPNAIDFVVENVQAVGYTGLRVEILRSNVRIPPGVPPTITSQPQGIKAAIGDSATFAVAASGTSRLHYQWRKDGADLLGQTSPTLTLAHVTPADSGNYSVLVTNMAGAAVSDSAALCVCLWPIPGIFGTGVGNDGALLANGSVDPHYRLTDSADLMYPGPDALVLIDGQFPIPPWVASGPNSKWISALADQTVGIAEGGYTFTTSFDLTGFDPAHVSLVGQWSVDNLGTDILVNSNSTGITSPGFSTFTPFTIRSGLVTGTNRLDFRMTNLPATPSPTGLRVDLRGLVDIGPFLHVKGSGDGQFDLSWACTNTNQVLQCAPTALGPWSPCANQSNPQTNTPCTHSASLDTIQEEGLPVGRTGSGVGTLTLSGVMLTLDVTFSGLSGTVQLAHIHGPAMPGQEASALYDLGSFTTLGGMSGAIRGTVTLSDSVGIPIATQLQQLNSGLWYVNIHTSIFGGGEIRGQIKPGCTQFYRVIQP